MKCPFCHFEDTQVKDSRPLEDLTAIKRRRQCSECGSRFTTFERVQLCELFVVKKDGRVVPFDRDKLARSFAISTRKRPVEKEALEKAIQDVVQALETGGETEIPAGRIGELVMIQLERLDPVAYVRFASVYRSFKEVKDFKTFVDDWYQPPTGKRPGGPEPRPEPIGESTPCSSENAP